MRFIVPWVTVRKHGSTARIYGLSYVFSLEFLHNRVALNVIKLHQICIMASFQKRGKSWFVQVRRKGVVKCSTWPTKAQSQAWATQKKQIF
jgi:hypothetical protein